MIDIFKNLRIVTNYYLKSVSLKSDFTFTHRVLVTIYYEFLLIYKKSKVQDNFFIKSTYLLLI
jgi:hypothetical protein